MFPFEPPPGLRITPLEADILSYLKGNPGIDYNKYPATMKASRTLENMRRRRLIRRKYEPTRHYLTREGTSVLSWVLSLREHGSKKEV